MVSVSGLRCEVQLVQIALETERTSLSMDQAIYSSMHPEDSAMARPLLEMRAETIAELEAFLSRATEPGAKPQCDT